MQPMLRTVRLIRRPMEECSLSVRGRKRGLLTPQVRSDTYTPCLVPRLSNFEVRKQRIKQRS